LAADLVEQKPGGVSGILRRLRKSVSISKTKDYIRKPIDAGISYSTYCGLYAPSSLSGNRQGRSGSVGAAKKTSGNAFVRKPGNRRSGVIISGRDGVSAYD